MIMAVLTQFLNVDNLIAEPAGVGDMLDRLHIAGDFECMGCSTETDAEPD
jgi:hypothetical protein